MVAAKGNFFARKPTEIMIVTAIAIVAASLIFYFYPFGRQSGTDDKPDLPKYLILEPVYDQSYRSEARLPSGEIVQSKYNLQSTFYTTSKGVEEVVSWYKQQLTDNGWEIKDESQFTLNSNVPEARTSGIQIFALNQDQTYRLNIFISPGANSQNQAGALVTLGYKQYTVSR